jgi:peptidyl-prolyl isomerase D
VPTPHLDKKHVVFGRVLAGKSIVRKIEHLKTQEGDKPWHDAVIADCGELKGEDYENALQTVPDVTGDPYEDYPEDQKPDEEWKGEEILKIATELKDLGNSAFKKGDLVLGVTKYAKALRYLHEYPEPLENDPPELGPALNALKISLYSNSALLHNKLKQFNDAIDDATKALGIEGISDKDKAKALFRRAQARIGKRGDEDAVKDLEEAVKLVPGDSAVVKELADARKRVKERREKEKKAYKNAFNFD